MHMVITKLEQTGRQKCRMYVNDEPVCVLFMQDIRTLGLKEEQEISKEKLEQIYSAVLARRAKLRCMNILQKMDKTEAQLREKLRKEEYPQIVIEEALKYVKSYHYVDDLRFAQNYITFCQERKSRQQITYELTGKGVAADVIEAAWDQTETVDPVELILRLAEKKQFDVHNADWQERQKFYNFLLRKGFFLSDIKKALT